MKIINKINKPIQLQVALVPVCKMVIRFGLHFHEFVRNLQKAYIHAAEEILLSSDIKPSLQAIAIKTGMDRRTISEHKTNKEKLLTNPLNKMDMVIKQLQLLSNKNNNLSLLQLKNSIDSIYARHIRSNAIIKELLANKIIIQQDSRTFKLNLTLQQQLKQIQLMADDVDYTAKRLFQTFYHNMFEPDENNDLRQSTCLSSKIAPRYQQKVHALLARELLLSEQRINKIMAEYESNVPADTYPELGITQFQFGLQETKN